MSIKVAPYIDLSLAKEGGERLRATTN
jgi:hypothetical protein